MLKKKQLDKGFCIQNVWRIPKARKQSTQFSKIKICKDITKVDIQMTHQQVKKMPVRQHFSLIPRYLPNIKIFVYTKTCTWTFVSTLFVKTKQETGTLSLFWGWTDQQGNNPLCSTGKEQITVPVCVSDALLLTWEKPGSEGCILLLYLCDILEKAEL